MGEKFHYYQGAELPGMHCPWLDAQKNAIDFTSGYTFSVHLFKRKQRYDMATAQVTGGVGYVDILWEPTTFDEFDGSYAIVVRARHSASSMDRDWGDPEDPPQIVVHPFWELAP